MGKVRFLNYLVLVACICLAIFSLGAGFWKIAGINFGLALINAVILYETRRL